VDALSKAWGLRPLACWDCGFDSSLQNACLSVVIVMFCQVEVSASRCGVSECDREAVTVRMSTATGGKGVGFCAKEQLLNMSVTISLCT